MPKELEAGTQTIFATNLVSYGDPLLDQTFPIKVLVKFLAKASFKLRDNLQSNLAIVDAKIEELEENYYVDKKVPAIVLIFSIYQGAPGALYGLCPCGCCIKKVYQHE